MKELLKVIDVPPWLSRRYNYNLRILDTVIQHKIVFKL